MDRVTVTFLPSGRTTSVPPGTSLLTAARGAGLPLAAACDASGVCGKCVVRVVAGADALAPADPGERVRLDLLDRDPDERLACRASAHGDVAVTTTYW